MTSTALSPFSIQANALASACVAAEGWRPTLATLGASSASWVTSSEATPAAVIDSRPPGTSFRYGHSPLASWHDSQCFCAAAQNASGTSIPTSAAAATPSRPYCEFELSQTNVPLYLSGNSCGG